MKICLICSLSNLGRICNWQPHDFNAGDVEGVRALVRVLVEAPVHERERKFALKRLHESTYQFDVIVVA